MTIRTDDIEALRKRFTLPSDDDPKSVKKRRLVKVATDLFARHGYKKTSIDDIARAAGVSKGTVYLYFSSKAELLVFATTAEKQAMAHRMMEVLDLDDPRERMRTLLRESLVLIHDMPLISALMQRDQELHQALDELGEELAGKLEKLQQRVYMDLLRPMLPLHTPEEEVLAHASNLVTLIWAMPTIAAEGERLGLDREQHARLFADALVDGLAR